MKFQVGRQYTKPDGTRPYFRYKDIEWISGWADAEKYLPHDGDFCNLELATNKVIPGWIHGDTWDGYRLKPTDKVIWWQRRPEDNPIYN